MAAVVTSNNSGNSNYSNNSRKIRSCERNNHRKNGNCHIHNSDDYKNNSNVGNEAVMTASLPLRLITRKLVTP